MQCLCVSICVRVSVATHSVAQFVPQLQCVKCSSIFAIPGGTLKQCLKCNSIFLVQYEPPPPREPPSLLREHSQLNAALLKESVEATTNHLMGAYRAR